MALPEQLGHSDEDVEFLFQFAGLHDIGKIAILDCILLKPGKLDADEYDIAKSHVHRGSEMIEAMMREFGLHNEHYARLLLEVITCHHEHWDGQGYPNGLAGEAIPLAGRIVAVAVANGVVRLDCGFLGFFCECFGPSPGWGIYGLRAFCQISNRPVQYVFETSP